MGNAKHAMKTSEKPVLISGIQPSGRLHLGNYLGALKNFVELQNSGKYRTYFFIADLHSMTEEYDPKEKSSQIFDLMADYLAAGLDPKQSVLFVQSDVPRHAELAWVLSTLTPMGELRRMTQFKEKSGEDAEVSNVGLFTYPVLMAADILLYDAAFVPVGDDQDQHLELARTLARKFNKRFPARNAGRSAAGGGETFIEPKPLHTNVTRLMSLDDPARKMSKSRPTGCLFLDDAPAVIRKKIMRAVTDSGTEILADLKRKPAIANLLIMMSALSGEPVRAIEERYHGATSYAEFKRELAEVVVRALEPLQKAKRSFVADAPSVEKIFYEGGRAASSVATDKHIAIWRAIGLGK